MASDQEGRKQTPTTGDLIFRPVLGFAVAACRRSFRPRLDELRPYYRTRIDAQGIGRSVLSVGPITFNRYPGEAPN